MQPIYLLFPHLLPIFSLDCKLPEGKDFVHHVLRYVAWYNTLTGP